MAEGSIIGNANRDAESCFTIRSPWDVLCASPMPCEQSVPASDTSDASPIPAGLFRRRQLTGADRRGAAASPRLEFFGQRPFRTSGSLHARNNRPHFQDCKILACL